MPFRRTDHPGVTVSRNRHGSLFARWRDPDTFKIRSTSLSKLGYSTKTKAAEWLRDKAEEIRKGRHQAALAGRKNNVDTPWETIESTYLTHFKGEHSKDAATRLERDWLRRWRKFLKLRAVRRGADLVPAHLMSFRAALGNEESLAPATRNRTLGAVRAYLTWAMDNGYVRLIGDHLRVHFKLFKAPIYQPRVLNRSELINLLEALVAHDCARHFASRTDKRAYSIGKQSPEAAPVFQPLAPFTLLALLTGARPGEVLAMKWGDIDFESRAIRVWGSKTMRERVVPLHDSPLLVRLLQALRKRAGDNVHVCGDWANDKPIELHDRQWRRVTKLAGIENAPMKCLRSTCIAHVASGSTENEYLLESRFGHGSNVSKAHYRRPLHGLSERGSTVEEWLGISGELAEAMKLLGYLAD